MIRVARRVRILSVFVADMHYMMILMMQLVVF
jgi:hypothetical protein